MIMNRGHTDTIEGNYTDTRNGESDVNIRRADSSLSKQRPKSAYGRRLRSGYSEHSRPTTSANRSEVSEHYRPTTSVNRSEVSEHYRPTMAVNNSDVSEHCGGLITAMNTKRIDLDTNRANHYPDYSMNTHSSNQCFDKANNIKNTYENIGNGEKDGRQTNYSGYSKHYDEDQYLSTDDNYSIDNEMPNDGLEVVTEIGASDVTQTQFIPLSYRKQSYEEQEEIASRRVRRYSANLEIENRIKHLQCQPCPDMRSLVSLVSSTNAASGETTPSGYHTPVALYLNAGNKVIERYRQRSQSDAASLAKSRRSNSRLETF